MYDISCSFFFSLSLCVCFVVLDDSFFFGCICEKKSDKNRQTERKVKMKFLFIELVMKIEKIIIQVDLVENLINSSIRN
jgi:hypothetical protein